MKPVLRIHQHHDIYRECPDQDSEISGLLGECGLIAIDRSKLDQMIPPGLFADGVTLKIGRLHAKLSRDEPDRFFWDDLSSRQEAAGVSKRAKLKGKPKPVL